MNRFDELWAIAESRRSAGEPMYRAPSLAYTPPPGESADPSPRYWLSEEEAQELHDLTLAMNSGTCAEAAERLRKKIAARNILNNQGESTAAFMRCESGEVRCTQTMHRKFKTPKWWVPKK